MGVLVKMVAAPAVFMSRVSEEIAKQRRLTLTNGAGWRSMFGFESSSGKTVTMNSALQLSTVWACIRLTAQAISMLPLKVYEKGSYVSVDHPLADIISNDPNRDETSLEFWEGMIAWMMTEGNGYAEKNMAKGGRITSLHRIPSIQVEPMRRVDDNEIFYRVTDRGKTEDMPRDKIFHLKGFGFDTLRGLSAIRYGVQTFGNSMAAEETIGRLYANGLQMSGVLSSDAVLKKDQRKQLQTIMESYAGSERAGKLMILEAGIKYQQLVMNPVDAQMLETRRFNIEEMCRWFGMPPIIIGHAAQGQTMWGTGVEQILLAWMTLGLNPICERTERRISKQLMSPVDRRRYYAEFTREAILQMDSTTKASFLSSLTQNGLMTRKEGRAKLNLPVTGQEGEESLTVQSNLAPLDKLGTQTSSQAAQNALRNWLENKE